MHCYRLSGFAAVLILMLATPCALFADTISFEGLFDSTPVTNQFAALGLLFSNTMAITAGITLNEFEFPPRSGDNVVFDDGGSIIISFSPLPVVSFGGYFTYLTPVTLTAFDALNNPVNSVSSAFLSNLALSGDLGSTPNELLQVSVPGGISQVMITGDPAGGSFTLDDATFAPIPEPGTLSLLIIGSLAFISARNKFIRH